MNKIKKIGAYWNKPQHAAYLFIAPAFLIVVLFTIVPLLMSFYVSLTNVTTYLADGKFIGLKNFKRLFEDDYFLNSWKVTVLFTIFDVPISIGFALFVAALCNTESKFNSLMRSIYILPIICSSTVLGLTWELYLDPQIGLGNYILQSFGLPKFSIFTDISLAIYGIIFISIWRGFGMTAMILVAAMQGVSTSLYEAAELDGANAWHKFWHVTIPGISSTLWFVFITRVIGSFQVFDLVYVITSGGPAHSTETVVSYIYDKAFTHSYKLGYASAAAECLFVVILLCTIFLYGRMLVGEKKGGVDR